VKQDRDLSPCSIDTQNYLAEIIHLAFSLLTACLQSELAHTMPAFLSPEAGHLRSQCFVDKQSLRFKLAQLTAGDLA